MTQKGETEKALKVAAFQKQIEEWAKRTRDSGERISPRAATEVPRPVAQPRQPPLVTQAKELEAKIYTINSRSHKGTNHTLTGTQAEESLTLSKTIQPHVVKGQYFVPEDKELTIEAGATIIFEKGASLYCQGNLMILGSDDAQIVLKGKTSAMDYWEGVYVNGVGTTIEWASISGAQSAVKINAQKASVRNCVLTRNTRGIEVTPSGRGAEFDNCLFISNAEDGLQIHEAANVVINGCSFIQNGKWGLWSGKSGVVVTSCLFQGNTAGGYSLRLERGGVQVSGCVFANNGTVDINAENTENNHLNFRQNYWGATVTRQLQRDGVGANLRNINDGHDSGGGNIVDVSEFLTEPPKECGSTLKW